MTCGWIPCALTFCGSASYLVQTCICFDRRYSYYSLFMFIIVLGFMLEKSVSMAMYDTRRPISLSSNE